MILRTLLAAAGILLALSPAAWAQTVTPQSSSRLAVSFTTERVGSGRVLVFGEVGTGPTQSCERVVVSVEGLDENGRTVRSRPRLRLAWCPRAAPRASRSHGVARLERRFRVEIESFQFVSSGN
jgi:hypothetical protein